MQQLKHNVQSFLDRLENHFVCQISFMPFTDDRKDGSLNPKHLKENKDNASVFFNFESYGYFFIQNHNLDDKSVKALEILIKEGVSFFLNKFDKLQPLQAMLKKHSSHSSSNNILNIFSNTKKNKEEVESSILFVRGLCKQDIMRSAIKIHNFSNRVLFMRLQSLMKKEGSFKDWSHFCFASLFISSWQGLENWQKNQIKEFISFYETSPSLKIIIGLEGKDTQWKIS